MRLTMTLTDDQALIVVIIEGVERIGVVNHHIEKGAAFIRRRERRVPKCAPDHLHQLPQFGNLLFANVLMHHIAFEEILFQHIGGPLAKSYTMLTMYTVAHRNNDIERLKGYRFLHPINVQKMHVIR